MSPFFLSPFSDIVSNCCLLAGHILASEFSVVLSKCRVRNRRKRRREGEVKYSDELLSAVVLVTYTFSPQVINLCLSHGPYKGLNYKL